MVQWVSLPPGGTCIPQLLSIHTTSCGTFPKPRQQQMMAQLLTALASVRDKGAAAGSRLCSPIVQMKISMRRNLRA